MNLIGAHLPRWGIDDIVDKTGVNVVQIFLNSPRTWDQSNKMEESEAANWRRWDVPVYVHSSYLINLASSNPEVRSKSLYSLQQQLDNAEQIAASGLVVHAGHASGEGVNQACEYWGDAIGKLDLKVPLLIENTAGGQSAPGRSIEGLQRLWEYIGSHDVGLCLDTCHAWAGGMGVESLGTRAIEAFGKVDLLHLNGSLDPFDSGRDRHSNLFDAAFEIEHAWELARMTQAPCILEVPGPEDAYMKDLQICRENLAD